MAGASPRCSTLKPEDRDVQLRLCWDREGRRCVVFDAAGEQLAELVEKDGPSRGLSETGVYIRNIGLNITLASLRVREWNGAAPPKAETRPIARGTHRRQRGERRRAWRRRKLSPGEDRLRTRKNDAGLEDVESIVLAPESGRNETSRRRTNFPLRTAASSPENSSGSRTASRPWRRPGARSRSAQKSTACRSSASRFRRTEGSRRKSPWRKWTGWWSARHPCTARRSDPTTACCAGFRPAACIPCRWRGDTQDIEVIRTILPDAPGVTPQALFFVDGGDVLPGVLRGMDANFGSPQVRSHGGLAHSRRAMLRRAVCRPRGERLRVR